MAIGSVSTVPYVAPLLPARTDQLGADVTTVGAATSPSLTSQPLLVSATTAVLISQQGAGAKAPTTASAVSTTQASRAATAKKAVDSLLASSGEAIYGAAISSLKQSPPNLASQLDNPKLADADRRVISDQMIAREKAAFGTFTDGVD
ncbi:hypothetical protein [Sphingomonas sp. PAMC 26621]|uniref:hypothetical protein n=1 Tax=Sphingomonas sp. PAMC 26621 TaxID=1112213 RepID=UPI0002891C2D|nr:hypothetical protein [Sphingomonas sp. PAMC 26621]